MRRKNIVKVSKYLTSTNGNIIKKLRRDGGKEFDNKEMRNILEERGMKLLLAAPYAPDQNGTADREYRTILKTMLNSANLPKILWREACNTAVYIFNRSAKSSKEGKTLFEIRHGRSFMNFEKFGTECYAYVPKQFR